MFNRVLNRRSLLRGTGVAMALPMLEAMSPRFVRAGASDAPRVPRRMVCICSNMGFMPEYFWPKDFWTDQSEKQKSNRTTTSDYLSLLDEHRNDLTVFGGLAHPDVDGGHHAEISFLTAAPHPASSGFKNTISLDQYAAERVGIHTRLPYLSLNVGKENSSLSFTASGVRIPSEEKPSAVFRRLFVQGNAREVETKLQELRDGRSVLDAVAQRAKRLQRSVGRSDRQKLDQYFESVRELEGRLIKSEAWEQKPKPMVDAELPADIDDNSELIARTQLMQRMMQLSLQTDSTRIIALSIDQNANPKVNLPGVSQGHHSLTHHGHRDDSVEQLKIIESAQMQCFGDFLGSLKSVDEDGESLLDRTMVLMGSNLGNANSHDNSNLPIVLAGGGFRHGRDVAFDRKHNAPLPNLYLSMLQRMGIETDSFASSTGTMRGLETN